MIRGSCCILALIVLFFPTSNADCPNTSGATRFSQQWPSLTEGQNITITGSILLDASPSVVLGYVWISGTLYVADTTLELRAQGVKVNSGGSLVAGGSDCPITQKVTFTFYGNSVYSGENTMGVESNNDAVNGSVVVSQFGSKGLIVATGGSLSLWGEVKGPSWTNLAATATKGSTTITLKDAVQWKTGDSIIITTTDFSHVYDYNAYKNNPLYSTSVGLNFPDQTERKIVDSVSQDGKTVTLTTALNYMHWGAGYQFAEVGLLTRHIVLQSDASAELNGYGGHFMMRKGNKIELSGIEVTRMGQRGVLARYPVHFHNMRFTDDIKPFIQHSSIHDNYQRCIVVHESHGVTIQNNVAYNTSGHCYFIEDGGESGNTFDRNLGATVTPFNLIPSDEDAAIFWIVNPNNTFTNNVAVGGQFGYWFGMPEKVLGIGAKYWPNLTPRTLPTIAFTDNVAHSNRRSGIQIDEMENPDGTTSQGNWLPNPKPLIVRILSYKNREFGIWGHSSLHFANCVLQDNAVGFMVNGETVLRDSLITGETDNVGSPTDKTKPRTVPSRWNNIELLGGHSSYDNGGPQISFRNTFENFVSTAGRPAGALIALRFGPFKLYPRNHFGHGLKFVNANPFYIDYSDFEVHYGWNVLDSDGSATGIPGGAWVQSNETIFNRDGCVWKKEWQANVCPTFGEGMVQFSIDVPVNPGAATGGTKLLKTDARTKVGALIRPLGSSADGPVGKMKINDVYDFTHNVIARRSYAFEFYQADGTPSLTPSRFTLNVPSSEYGDWVIFAFPYPSGTTFTLAGPQWDTNRKWTLVSSWAELSPWTYMYDANSKHFYLLIQNQQDSTMFMDVYGFGVSAGNYYPITITATCPGGSCQPAFQGIPPTFQLPKGVQSEDYSANLELCQSKNRPSQPKSGKGFFLLHPQGFSGKVELHFKIFHDISGTGNQITIREASVGSEGTPVVGQKVAITNTAASGVWYLTRYLWEKLASGNLYVSVADSTGNEVLRGQIRCTNNGGCTIPTASSLSLGDVCNPSYQKVQVYSENEFTAPGVLYGWATPTMDGAFKDSVLCGSTSLRITAKTGAAGVVYWTSQNALTLDAKYVTMEMFIKNAPGYGNCNLEFYTRTSDETEQVNGLAISLSEIDNFVVDEVNWSRVRIPRTRLGLASGKPIKVILFRCIGYPDKGIDFIVDEWRWITEAAAPITTLANIEVPMQGQICVNPSSFPSLESGRSGDQSVDNYSTFPNLQGVGSASRFAGSVALLATLVSLVL